MDTQSRNRKNEFEQVYKKYYTQLFYKALDWTLDEDIAKDLVGELFADLWQKFDDVRVEDVAGLLHTALRNKVVNMMRHEKVKRRYDEEYISTTSELMDEPDEVHEEQLKKLERVIEEQPVQRKFIFKQCCIEGKSYKEVSEIIGVEVSTVHKHVSRVYKELRKAFGLE